MRRKAWVVLVFLAVLISVDVFSQVCPAVAVMIPETVIIERIPRRIPDLAAKQVSVGKVTSCVKGLLLLTGVMTLLSDLLRKMPGKMSAIKFSVVIAVATVISFTGFSWSQPDKPRGDPDRATDTSLPGTHVNLTVLSIDLVGTVYGKDSWIYQALSKHKLDLLRGQLWADDYPYDWADTKPSERYAWNVTIPSWVPMFGGKVLFKQLPKHKDGSVTHVYAPEDWLCKAVGEENCWNAVLRAEFWYKEALDAYQLHGDKAFPDQYSEDHRKVTAYDYLGRALHYVQDMACPSHFEGGIHHIFKDAFAFWKYEGVYSKKIKPEGSVSAWRIWTNGSSGRDFAEEAHRRLEGFLKQYENMCKTLGAKGCREVAFVEIINKNTPKFLRYAIEVGAGMLVKFHEQVSPPEPTPTPTPVQYAVTATILVIDVSGSMAEQWKGGIKIESAKKAALQFIEQVANEPRSPGSSHLISVVTFSTDAELKLPLTGKYNEAKKVVISLGTIAWTNVGAGLVTALKELDKVPAAKRFIILLSDGMTNTGMSREQILSGPVVEAKAKGICIHTVGFGDKGNMDEDFLKKVAINSGCGSYHYAASGFELFGTFIKIRHSVLGSNRIYDFNSGPDPIILLPGWTALLGAFQLTAPAQELHYTLAWSEPGRMWPILVDPRGQEVTNRYPGVTFYSGTNFVHVMVKDPMRGIWRMSAKAQSSFAQGVQYYGVASARTGGIVIPFPSPLPPCISVDGKKICFALPDLPTALVVLMVVTATAVAVYLWLKG